MEIYTIVNNKQVAFDSDMDFVNSMLFKYGHPFIKEVREKALLLCGERARDFIMGYRLIYCLRKGLP